MQAARNIAAKGAIFTDSLAACDIFNTRKDTKQPIRKTSGTTKITDSLQLVNTDLLGPLTTAAREIYRFMTNLLDRYTKFKAV